MRTTSLLPPLQAEHLAPTRVLTAHAACGQRLARPAGDMATHAGGGRAWITRTMRCAACSFENPDGFRFCGSCGSPLDGDHLGGERRRVTVAFADLVGYSTLAE